MLFNLLFIFSYLLACECIMLRVGKPFPECHDDFTLKPSDGIINDVNVFNWLGIVHYIDVNLGIPNMFIAPRVVLIHKQFAIGTAKDLLEPPKNKILGNIFFGQYHRDELTCGLTMIQTIRGVTCDPAYLETSYTEIIPHPEYARFGVPNSLALMRLTNPMESRYMIPICFPSIIERELKIKSVFLVDYTSSVPENFMEEKMAKKTLSLRNHKICKKRHNDSNLTYLMCTSGCGIRSGAPIVNHARDGAFELVGISIGGTLCLNNSMRNTFNDKPPLYIDVYPYVRWIVATINARLMPVNIVRRSVGDDIGIMEGPSRSLSREVSLRRSLKQRQDWSKTTFLAGDYCFYDQAKQKEDLRLFYVESFLVNTTTDIRLHFILRVSAGVECTIECVRVKFPNGNTEVEVEGLGGFNVTIEFLTTWFPKQFVVQVAMTGRNSTLEERKKYMQKLPMPAFWAMTYTKNSYT